MKSAVRTSSRRSARWPRKPRCACADTRRDAIDNARKGKKDGDLTEDQLGDLEGNVQKITDQYIKSIEDQLMSKETDIMKV